MGGQADARQEDSPLGTSDLPKDFLVDFISFYKSHFIQANGRKSRMENQEGIILSALSEMDLQKAMLGYETAIQLWAAEIQNRMSHYNAMLVANSFILAAIGFLYQTTNFSEPIRFFLSIMGIMLCAIWYLSEKRALEKSIYWLHSATEIEGKYFSAVFTTLNRRIIFHKGKTVTFLFEGKIKHLRMKFWGRLFKTKEAFSFIILLIAIIYMFVLAIEIIR
jgi:hypothetical protein